MFTRCSPPTTEQAGARLESELNQRILVVEDDLLIRRLLPGMLIFSGCAVDAARDRAAASDALQLNRYDPMMTGNETPKASGVALLWKVQAIRPRQQLEAGAKKLR